MTKFLGVVFLAVILAYCEAGLLEVVGGKTEELGKTIHKGAVRVEEKISSFLGSHHSQPEVPPVPTSSSSAKASASASASANSQGSQQFQQKPLPTFLPNFKPPVPPLRPQHQPDLHQQNQAPPQNTGGSTVTNDQSTGENLMDNRNQLKGAAWCDPEETFEHGECRPT